MVKGIQSKHIVGIAHERHKLITYFNIWEFTHSHLVGKKDSASNIKLTIQLHKTTVALYQITPLRYAWTLLNEKQQTKPNKKNIKPQKRSCCKKNIRIVTTRF